METTKTPNAHVQGATVTQSANEVLGKKETSLYYLIIQTTKGKMTINVGEKTYKAVQELTDITTKLQFEQPQPNKTETNELVNKNKGR